jgi:hypothetical protein
MEKGKKKQIVLASVLKPVDDTRMFEKFAMTLATLSDTEVHVIGIASRLSPQLRKNIHLHPFRSFKRISLRRLAAPWTVLFRTLRIRPDIFIFTTHELIWQAFLIKLLSGAKVMYDVQEDYRINILHTTAFPQSLRPIVATYVRLKERFSCLFVDHHFLAEKSYAKVLTFIGEKFTVLENRVSQSVVQTKSKNPDDKVRLLFTGTLDDNTGVFEAINFAEKLHAADRRVMLKIIGYAARNKTRERLKTVIHDKPFIELIGGDTLVPHSQIMNEIAKADFGIISYPINPVTQSKTPTKYFEYVASRLPVLLLTNHERWAHLIHDADAGVLVDGLSPAATLEKMRSGIFYRKTLSDIFWGERQFLSLPEFN